jgi:uncharacterized protein YcbK (DUF882 family)
MQMATVLFKKEEVDRLTNEFRFKIDLRLQAVLFELATWMGRTLSKGVIVTCLLRTPEENAAVNGRPYSSHLDGRAADIRTYLLSHPEIDKVIAHLNSVWGIEFLHTKYHDSGAGMHLHININFPFKRELHNI